jgi:hypothetical protein
LKDLIFDGETDPVRYISSGLIDRDILVVLIEIVFVEYECVREYVSK